MPRPHRPLVRILVTASLLGACTSGSDRAALERILESDRRAHFETDAGLLAANLADSLLVVDGSRVHRVSREDVRRQFEAVFDGAVYHRWEDLEPPAITVSADGSMAWVTRRVSVDREAPGLGGRLERERFESAWTATYAAADGAWRMTSVTSTFARIPDPALIVAGARRATGADPGLAGVGFVRFDASATGPGGAFSVRLAATPEGAVRVDFSEGLSAAIGRAASWVRTAPDAEVETLGDTLATFVRGHDLVMNLLAPGTRFASLRYAGIERFDGREAIRLDGIDAVEGPVQLYYARADTLPLGFAQLDHVRGRGRVTVTVGDWRAESGIRLPHFARFVQGEEIFEYHMEMEVLSSAPEDAFASP